MISIYDFNTPGPGGSRNLEEICHDLTTCDDHKNMDYGRAEKKMGLFFALNMYDFHIRF